MVEEVLGVLADGIEKAELGTFCFAEAAGGDAAALGEAGVVQHVCGGG